MSDDLTGLAARLAVDMVAQLGYDPSADGDDPDGWDGEREDFVLDGIAHTLALEAGYDVERLRRLRDHLAVDSTPWFVASIAHIVAINTRESDEEKAAHLARLVSAGIPVRARGWAPRHARMAAELVDDVNLRLWLLTDFAGQASSLS